MGPPRNNKAKKNEQQIHVNEHQHFQVFPFFWNYDTHIVGLFGFSRNKRRYFCLLGISLRNGPVSCPFSNNMAPPPFRRIRFQASTTFQMLAICPPTRPAWKCFSSALMYRERPVPQKCAAWFPQPQHGRRSVPQTTGSPRKCGDVHDYPWTSTGNAWIFQIWSMNDAVLGWKIWWQSMIFWFGALSSFIPAAGPWLLGFSGLPSGSLETRRWFMFNRFGNQETTIKNQTSAINHNKSKTRNTTKNQSYQRDPN